MRKSLITLVALLMAANLFGSNPVEKIIEEGTVNNRTMDYIDILSNRIGGRIIGSHSLNDAEKWVESQFRSWGLDVIIQEVGHTNVGFDRGPWFGRMLSEDGMDLHFTTPSYTAGTKGPQIGRAIIAPKANDVNNFNSHKAMYKDAWVLLDIADDGFPVYIPKKNEPDTLFLRAMVEAGALGFIQKATNYQTTLYDRKGLYDLTWETLPEVCQIKLKGDEFDKIYKKASVNERFFLEFDIRNHFFMGPSYFHNVIGVIKGSKYPDEYVMCGGHLDAYDSATGSVDDGQGVAVAMEAARLIAMSGAKPERTIMFCIWTGEEDGLLGSHWFVDNGGYNLNKISNYFNRDGGPLCATSITVPPAMFEDFQKVCKPLSGLKDGYGFEVRERKGEPQARPEKASGSDHGPFAVEGVPTLSFTETNPEGIHFNYREIWHTSHDLYYQVIPQYVERSSVVTAVTLLGIANLNHLLSREGLYKN